MSDLQRKAEGGGKCSLANVLTGCLIAFVAVHAAGCEGQVTSRAPQETKGQAGEVTTRANKTVDYDVGEVNSDVVYDCIIGGSDTRIVESVTKSCGCASVALNEGDIVDFSKPFKISVSMKGKPAGAGSQQVVIGFTDGSVFRAALKYDYHPPPSASPEYLVFKGTEAKRDVSFTFPAETNVTITTVEAPPYLASSVTSKSDDNKTEIALRFEVNRSLLNGAKDGVIDIATSSNRQAAFRIPYLILDN